MLKKGKEPAFFQQLITLAEALCYYVRG